MMKTLDYDEAVADPAGSGAALRHPREVLDHQGMSVQEKRALLAFWASDIHAVPDAPALRRIADGAVIGIDDILEALKGLDHVVETKDENATRLGSAAIQRRRGSRRMPIRLFRRDDDDDPPSAPAAAGIPVPPAWEYIAARQVA